MSRRIASAPGKLVLCGEYAVLDGATAVCAAVDRRAVVTARDIPGDHHVIKASGYSAIDGVFRFDAGRIDWLQGAGRYGLFEHVWRQSSPRTETAQEFVLDTSAFHDPGSKTKIGVGSSAALAVALAKALESIGGRDAASVARRAHRLFQAGLGSGIDIACSQSGGVIAFRREGSSVNRIEWPDDLHYAVFWSGVAADTRAKIARLDGAVEQRLVDSANHCAQEFADGAANDIVAALREYTEVLRAFDRRAGIGIFAAGHGELADLSAAHDIVYKPCGAGGGDIGIAVATSAESLASFVGAASSFKCLDLRFEPAGVRLDDKT